jgi:hypothetical protein
MKGIIQILLLIIFYGALFSQGIRNESANIVITNGGFVYVDGDANGGFTNNGTGQIESDGTFLLEGDWTNNGSTDVYTSIDNTGSTVFGGTTLQQIGGSHITNFENLTMNNSGVGAYISQNQQIEYTLTMTDGDFDLRDNNVQLVDLTSTVASETSAKRIKATSGGADGAGSGTIYTIRNNPSGNIANLGLTVNLTGIGVNIIRGHLVQPGTGTFAGNNSVFRYFQIDAPAIFAGTNVTFEDCYPQELNAHNPAQLIMFQWVNGGGSDYWTPVTDYTGAAVPITKNLFGSTLAWTKVTLGSEATPLPVELIEFSAECYNNNVELYWITASEINNDYFSLEKSNDGFDFYEIGIIPGNGNSNEIMSYSFIDYQPNPDINYYRLKQIDFDGKYSYSDIISENCSTNSESDDIFIYNSPYSDDILITLKGDLQTTYYVSFIDQIGRTIIQEKINFYPENKKFTINKSGLSAGVYNVVLRSKDNVITKQVVICR